jgi:signal transduction histidine kinase
MRSLFVVLSLVLMTFAHRSLSQPNQRVQQGTIDLSQWDFSADKLVELHGEWLCQSLGEVGDCVAPGSLRSVPFTHWRSLDQVRKGQALYSRLETTVSLPRDQRDPLFLNIRDVFGAWRLTLSDPATGVIYFDQQFGSIAAQHEHSIPMGGEVWAPLPLQPEVKISIEISSSAASYGLFRPPVIGRPELIHALREKNLLQMAMIIGAFALLGLYSLALFAQRTQDKGHLIIGALSLVLALRQLASEGLIGRVLGVSELGFYLQSDTLYLSFIGSVVLFAAYLFHRVDRLRAWKKPIFIGFGLLGGMEIVAISAQIFHARIPLATVFVVTSYVGIILICAIYEVMRIKNVDREMQLVRLSLMIPVGGILYDAAVGQFDLGLPYIAHYTNLAFILAQSVLVGRAFARSFSENERLLIEVREKEKSRTVFFHNTSHELRTPLNGIIGFLELLINGRYGELSSEASVQLQKCVRLAHSLKNQVNTILDLAKSRKGTLELSNSQFRLGDLINEAQDLAEGLLLKFKNTEFELQVESGLAAETWVGDYGKLATILRNLLGNAFKFAEPGRANRVSLRLRIQDQQLVMEVRDSGIGIPKDQEARVFEEFKQVEGDARRAYEGTGLGLSMVRDICRLMGGRVELESVFGQGSLFRVMVPRQTRIHLTTAPELVEGKKSSALAALAAPTSVTRDAAPTKGHILVVDDNEINCEVLRDLLLGDGYEVSVAHGGVEALQKARSSPPDLMLLDMMMPQMSGEDVLLEMKKDSTLEDIPVILVTARASEDDRIFGLSLGADDYLAKPIQHEELSFRVRNLLKRIEIIHKMDAIEEQERMAQLGEMMRELSHELKNLFQLGKLDKETIQESSLCTLRLLPLAGEAWQAACHSLCEGRHLEEIDLQQLPFVKPEDASNKNLRSLRFILAGLPLDAGARKELWQMLSRLTIEEQTTCELVLTLVRSYQLLEQQAHHAAELVVSILDYSRSSQHLGACRLDEVWNTLYRLIHPRLRKHRIEIRPGEMALTLPINAAHLMQILLNLLGNAVDAMQSLPVDQRWIAINSTHGERLEVLVENAGAPIPADLQSHLFERGVSSKGSSGSGLGLFIARKLMQRASGQIRYDSRATHPRFVLTWNKEDGEDALRKVS